MSNEQIVRETIKRRDRQERGHQPLQSRLAGQDATRLEVETVKRREMTSGACVLRLWK